MVNPKIVHSKDVCIMHAKTTKDPKKIFIVGPTGTGKSQLATELATCLKGSVINVDSCQIYQNLPILTAQPSQFEQKPPHYLYGFVPLTHSYNVARYVEDVRACLQTGAADSPQVFVGGTGLYVKALQEGLTQQKVSMPIKDRVRQNAADFDICSIYATLKKHRPNFSVHPNDHQRILRAFESYLINTDADLTVSEKSLPPLCPDSFVVFINPEPLKLRGVLKERIDQMCEAGVIEEVKTAIHTSNHLGPTVNKVIGLAELVSYLNNEIPLETAKEKIFFRTCQYAKRQRTWFRHQIKNPLLISEFINETTVQKQAQLVLSQLETG